MRDLFDLSGKKAIVTGGADGLGQGMAEGLHEAGAEIAIIDISPRASEVATAMRRSGPRVTSVRADLSDRVALRRGFDEAMAFLGGLDILVNAAGVQKRHRCEDFPLEDWDCVLETNLTAVFQLCQLAGRLMLRQGHGKIINIASLLSFSGGITVPAYAASKGGVAQLTKALANEWAAQGVNVNALAPGYMATALNAALIGNPQREPAILARVPARRWGTPSDLKGAIIFLASAASDFVNGAVLTVDGGFLAR